MEDIDKIKDRIAKLLRMAADNTSPHEAAIAASRARSLMDKYQIDAAQIAGDVKEEFGTQRASRDYTNVPTYMNILSVAVAQFNDCQSVTDWNYGEHNKIKKTRRFIVFRGYKNDADLALAMFTYLINTIDKLCKQHLLDQGITGRYPRDIGEAFKIACSSELCRRIRALTQERNESALADNAAQPGTGLAIIKKVEEVDDHFGGAKYTKSKSYGRLSDGTRDAREAGAREGRKIEIQRSVNGGARKQLES